MNIWTYISNIGIKPEQPFELVRKIRLCNQLAFLISASVLAYFITELLFFERRNNDFIRVTFYAHHILLTALVIPVLWLNNKARYKAASIVLITVACSMVFISGMVQAQPYRTEFYFLGLGAALFVLFTDRTAILIMFCSIFILFAISVYNVSIHQPALISFDIGLIFRISIAFSFLFAVLFLLISEGNKNRNIIQQKSSNLEIERDEVLRANFTKDRVLSVISHDLRGPLNSLSGILKLYSSGQLSQEEFHMHTARITKQVDHLRVSLEELLSWSRSKGDNLNPQPESIHIVEIISSAISGIQSLAEEKNITIETKGHDQYMFVDIGMIRSVFTNLLTNAIKFTNPHGKVFIKWEVVSNALRIHVVDTGIGISTENLDQIFSGNFTTPGTNDEKGTGIGLSLCKDFIQKNNGSISVTSKLNIGTTFTVTLPTSSTPRPS